MIGVFTKKYTKILNQTLFTNRHYQYRELYSKFTIEWEKMSEFLKVRFFKFFCTKVPFSPIDQIVLRTDEAIINRMGNEVLENTKIVKNPPIERLGCRNP